MKLAKIDSTKINDCMDASGGLTADASNTELEKMISSKELSGAIIIPSVFINQVPIRGELSYRNVFRAICAGYASGSEPSICQSCMYCNDAITCVTNRGKCEAGYGSKSAFTLSNGGSSISLVAFFIAISIIVLVFTIVGYCLYQRQQRRMRNEIRGILAEYMPVGSYV